MPWLNYETKGNVRFKGTPSLKIDFTVSCKGTFHYNNWISCLLPLFYQNTRGNFSEFISSHNPGKKNPSLYFSHK